MEFYVYEIRDEEELLYIGKGQKRKGYDRVQYYTSGYYKRFNRWIDNKLKKIDSFEVNILERFEEESKAIDREIELIQELKPLCNLTSGGDGISGYRHTEEVKEAMTGPGREVSITNLQKAVEANTGKSKLDKYTTEHILETLHKYGIYPGGKVLGVSGPTARKWLNNNGFESFKSRRKIEASLENRIKASEANIGKKPTKETRKKISEAQKGRTIPEERKRRISETLKKYYQNKKK